MPISYTRHDVGNNLTDRENWLRTVELVIDKVRDKVEAPDCYEIITMWALVFHFRLVRAVVCRRVGR